jgi:hypothetical protein
VLDDLFAEGALGEGAGLEQVDGLVQRAGDVGQVARRVHVAHETLGWLGLVGDAVEPGGQQTGQRQVRVAVGARDAALDPQRVA